jgi:hypothetical protein
MKKMASKRSRVSANEIRANQSKGRAVSNQMRDHYQFDYAKARPNRFAPRLASGDAVAVVLDADVAKVFTSSESVNNFLRSAIKAMPPVEKSKKKRAS